MTKPSCANCGATLRAPGAICKRCEQELIHSLADPTKGKYRCPRCARRFDKPMLDWWPHDAPWYRLQMQKQLCPHCKILLRDRKRAFLSPSESLIGAALFFALIVSSFLQLTKALSIVAACLLAILWVVELVRWWRERSSVGREQERYAIDESAN